jgi:hypothetical protein
MYYYKFATISVLQYYLGHLGLYVPIWTGQDNLEASEIKTVGISSGISSKILRIYILASSKS